MNTSGIVKCAEFLHCLAVSSDAVHQAGAGNMAVTYQTLTELSWQLLPRWTPAHL